MTDYPLTKRVVTAAARLADEVDAMRFDSPVTHVYNPLRYAWDAHRAYLKRLNPDGVRVVFLGMNPGPWGMAQTGVPFGEVSAVRDWLNIRKPIGRPANEHPKRPVQGLDCPRSEVSGRRLWGLFQDRFGTAEAFFEEHLVVNYCPLVFMEESARNRTPDKLAAAERRALDEACDRHLREILVVLAPEFVVGVGAFAEKCLRRTLDQGVAAKLVRILHPSPASPAANRDWAGKVTEQLQKAHIW